MSLSENVSHTIYMVAATGVIVAAVYYILNIRTNAKNQELMLKAQQQAADTRQAQLFMQVFSKYHDTEFMKNWLMIMNRDWKNYDEWNQDRWNLELGSARMAVTGYFEGVGLLVQRGLLPANLVSEILGSAVIMWWNKHSDYVKDFRVKSGFTNYADQVEYLYDEMLKLNPAGYSPSIKG